MQILAAAWARHFAPDGLSKIGLAPPEVGILCKVFPSPLMAKAIPVTGSAGLSGSEVCVYFAAQGRKSLGKIVTR